MPKIAVFQAFTFYLYFYDILNEPPHLHVTKNKKGYKGSAKIWLESLKYAETGEFTKKELNTIEKLVKSNQKELLFSIQNLKDGVEISVLNLKR